MKKLADKAPQFIYFAYTAVEKRHSQKKFSEIGGFPFVVGCVDGTHIRILRPRVDESQYVCQNGYHSINVQAICDQKAKFIYVSAKWPGSTNDSFILRNSAVWTAFEAGDYSGIILRDSAYPLRRWLMTPFRDTHNIQSKIACNSSLCKTRVFIEQVFGRLKRHWGILHQEVRVATFKVPKLVVACMILHNIAIEMNMPEFDSILDSWADDENAEIAGQRGNQHDWFSYRNHIVETYCQR